MSAVRVVDLGLCDYAETHAFQKRLVAKKRKDLSCEDVLVLVEHPDVYTQGRKGLVPLGASVVEVERGGETTFHNPGQLVAYPILSLHAEDRDLHAHLRRLESTLIDVLSGYDVASERRVGATGVWITGKHKKIASIGVAVSGWVTYHGSALNVTNDLGGFSRIHPCGFSSEVMTSLAAELGRKPRMADVKQSFIEAFLRNFSRFRIDDSVAEPASATI